MTERWTRFCNEQDRVSIETKWFSITIWKHPRDWSFDMFFSMEHGDNVCLGPVEIWIYYRS